MNGIAVAVHRNACISKFSTLGSSEERAAVVKANLHSTKQDVYETTDDKVSIIIIFSKQQDDFMLLVFDKIHFHNYHSWVHNITKNTLLNRLYGVWQRVCLPGTFVFKTLAIETNFSLNFRILYQKMVLIMSLNPLLPAKHFKRTRISLPSCTAVSVWNFS